VFVIILLWIFGGGVLKGTDEYELVDGHLDESVAVTVGQLKGYYAFRAMPK